MNLGPLELLILVCFGIGFAVGSGIIASKKGYSFAGFAVLGFFFPLIGIIVAAAIPDKGKKETNKDAAVAEALASYAQLLEQGIITQAEFNEKKRELLAK